MFGKLNKRVSVCWLLWPVVVVAAAAGPDPVLRVERVRFAEVVPLGGVEAWYEVAIELRGLRRELERLREPVWLGLELAWHLERGHARTAAVFRSEVRFLPPLSGEGQSVRFYLPPTVTERWELRGDPEAWRVRLEQGGVSLGQRRGTYSESLADPPRARAFAELLLREGTANEGLLQPIYRTPFMQARDTRWESSPAYLRCEGKPYGKAGTP